MKEKIIQTINEDIDVLRETLSNFQRMKDNNPNKKEFVERTKEDIQWMLDYKQKYLTKNTSA